MIAFNQDTTLEIVESYNEELDRVETCQEFFKADEKVDADIISEDGELVDLQFGDGAVALSVERDLFRLI